MVNKGVKMIKILNVFSKIMFFVLFMGVLITSLAHNLQLCTLFFGLQIVFTYTAVLTEDYTA